MGNEYGSYSLGQGEWVTNILGVFRGFFGGFREYGRVGNEYGQYLGESGRVGNEYGTYSSC